MQARGSLLCGVNESVPGFGFRNPDGTLSGFDIDFCKAVAAAVLGDPEAVEYVPLTAQQRFTALQSGEIDVLIRNTTYTASRDGGEGATFLHTTFYDGQGMMVRADSGFTALEDLANTAICVLSGTTTELNLATRFADIPYEPLTFEDDEVTPGGVRRRAMRRLDFGQVTARGRSLGLPRGRGRSRRGGDPRGDVLEGAARPGGP